jgi:lysophospholipase L1-like esterase
MSARGGMLRALLVVLPLTLGAVLAAWPADGHEAPRPFQAPGLIRVEHQDGEGRAADLSALRGRITGLKRLGLVFAWLPEVASLEVEDPDGVLELLVGDRAETWSSLVVLEQGLRLSTGTGAEVSEGVMIPRPPSRRVALVVEGGRAVAQVDGEPVGEGLVAAPPRGTSRVVLWKRTSVQSLSVTLPTGVVRTVEVPGAGTTAAFTWWSGLTTFVGCLATLAWWRSRTTAAGAPALTGPLRPAAWVLSAAVAVHLPLAALSGLADRNAERLSPPTGSTSAEVHHDAGPVEVLPGRPLDLHPRRDGDATLTATLVLDPGSLVDVLVRGDDPSQDRGVIVGLSAREGVPCDTVVNLGATLAREVCAPAREPGRPVTLQVTGQGADVIVTLDGEQVARRRCHDLRAGRTAIVVLSGRASVTDLTLTPAPAAVADDVLGGWLLRLGLVLGGGLALLALLGRRPAVLLWAWPLAAVVSSPAPAWAVLPAEALAAVLLLMTRVGPASVPAWLCGAALLVGTHWSLHEGPPARSAEVLSRMEITDVSGGPLPEPLIWARHPLVRRFNPWAREQNLRGRRVSFAPPEDRPRLLALGSSSTYGYGVNEDQAWPAQLERLAKADGTPLEVLNAGVPGSTARRLLYVLRHSLLQLEPDVVVVSLSFNDHIDLAVHDETAHFDAMTSEGIGWFVQALARWNARGARARWLAYFGHVMDGGEPDPGEREATILAPSRRFAASLQAMAEAVRAAGGEIVFVQEPPRDAVHPHMLGPYHEAIAELGARLGVAVCAPKTALDQAGEQAGKPLYLDMVHLDTRGHRVMAQQVAATLAQAGLLAR